MSTCQNCIYLKPWHQVLNVPEMRMTWEGEVVVCTHPDIKPPPFVEATVPFMPPEGFGCNRHEAKQ
jgi:hypothetical protein